MVENPPPFETPARVPVPLPTLHGLAEVQQHRVTSRFLNDAAVAVRRKSTSWRDLSLFGP